MRNALRLRTAAVLFAGTAAVTIQLIARNWVGAAVASLACAAWLLADGVMRAVLLRRSPRLPAIVVQVAMIAIGLLLVWRLPFAWFPLAMAGMWSLLVATDMELLIDSFPVDAMRARQRNVLRQHLRVHAILGAIAAGVAVIGSAVSTRLPLFTVMLLATLLVVILRVFARALNRDP